MINVYKLKYKSKYYAVKDLTAKEVIDADLNYLQGTHAVVWLDKIVIDQTEEGEPIFADGYHVDIMVDREIEFKNGIIKC